MKKISYYSFWILLATSLLTSCSDDETTISLNPESYAVFMFVTNDAGEDLILNSDKYYHTTEEFRFDFWKVYLDGKLIQTADTQNNYWDKAVNYLQYDDVDKKNISLDSNCEIQQRIKDSTSKHIVEYVVSSASLFGNSEEHTIHMEFIKTEDEYGYLNLKKYTISVDGVEQEVFYPIGWKDLYPKSQYESIIFPYFILNVDKLSK